MYFPKLFHNNCSISYHLVRINNYTTFFHTSLRNLYAVMEALSCGSQWTWFQHMLKSSLISLSLQCGHNSQWMLHSLAITFIGNMGPCGLHMERMSLILSRDICFDKLKLFLKEPWLFVSCLIRYFFCGNERKNKLYFITHQATDKCTN